MTLSMFYLYTVAIWQVNLSMTTNSQYINPLYHTTQDFKKNEKYSYR